MRTRHARAAATLLGAVMLCAFTPTQASLQGLYTMAAGTGQLRRVDWLNGSAVDVGEPLAAAGLHVADCAASVVQQTNKWFFTLATNASSEPNAAPAVHLVGVSLDDAEIQYFALLPLHMFPAAAALGPCDFTLDVDGGLVLFASAVVGDRLLTARFSHAPRAAAPAAAAGDRPMHKRPAGSVRALRASDSDYNVTVALNVSVAALGMGGRVAFPSSAMLPSGDFWYQLEGGAVGHNVVTGDFVNKVQLPSVAVATTNSTAATTGVTAVLGGLVYSLSSLHVHAVLTTRATSSVPAVSSLAEFDPLAAAPALTVSNQSFPAVARDGAAVALLSDKAQMTVLAGDDASNSGSDSATLLTLDLDSGHPLANVANFCTPPGTGSATDDANGKGGEQSCPSSIGYLPFVF